MGWQEEAKRIIASAEKEGRVMDIEPEPRFVPEENWQEFNDINEAQLLGFKCPRCGAGRSAVGGHWSMCSIYKPAPKLSEKKSQEWVDGKFNKDDRDALLRDEAILEILRDTTVTPEVAEQCARELREASKRCYRETESQK